MKMHILRTVCLMFLVIFLCGCGKETEVLESQPTGAMCAELPEGFSYFVCFEDAGRANAKMYGTGFSGSSLRYYTNVYDAERNVHVQDVYVQEEGKEAQKLLSFGDGGRLLNMASGGDGSWYFLYKEQTGEETQIYTLEKRDKELQVIYSIDTTEGMEDIPGIYEMKAGADGTLYGLTTKGIVLYWDETGSYQGRFTLPVSALTAKGGEIICFGLADAGESGVYAYWEGEDQESRDSIHLYNLKNCRQMDEAGQGLAAPLRIDVIGAESVVSAGDKSLFGNERDSLYLGDRNQLWQIDLTDGSLKPLLVWKDINLQLGYVTEIQSQEDGGFLMYVFDTLEQENYWVTLEPVPASELAEKHELVLGVAGDLEQSMSLTTKISQVALSYNRTHPYSHVTVKEYGRSNITSFQMELLKGEGPDILIELESFFDMESLAAKGVVEDLAPYLAESEVEILPGIRNLITKNGEIPRIPLSFSVDIMILPEGMGQDVLTPQEMAAFVAKSEYADLWVSPSLLSKILFGAEMDHYVNEEVGSCSFDSEEFITLLESMAKLGDMERISSRGERAELFRGGQINVIVEEMYCLLDYFCFREALSGVGEIGGFPNSSGELRYPAKLYDWMGINSATKYKEEAWDFIEFCLSYMSRSDDVQDRFVVTKDKFKLQTRFEKADSCPVLGLLNDYNENWHGLQMIDPMTDEETELLWGISDHLYFYEDDDLLQIISEEAGMFFSGAISAQEAAERIQNRASLVVGE